MSIAIGARPLEVLDLAGPADRSPLVLLHEGLGSVGLWRDFPAALRTATGSRVIAYSRHGHGQSAAPAGPPTARGFHHEALDVLPELLDKLDASDPVLVGHSDGASISLIHAAHRPVAGLVLIAPHVFVEQLTVDAIRNAREAYLGGELRERMARHHRDPDVAFWKWCDMWLDPEFREWSIEEEAGRITAPTLLIQGAEDAYGSLDQLARIEARVRGPVRRKVLPGGHSPHLEHQAAVVDAIASFTLGIAGLDCRHGGGGGDVCEG
jgi:pimeloyl-ACP methyl ester carboxylesterase